MTKPGGPIFPEITEDAVQRMADAPNPRLADVMAILVRHLHAAVRESAITEEEWVQTVNFLTATGQKCTDTRQEFILLSDVLGVSMLVDAINHVDGDGITESTVFGPFYAGRQRTVPYGGSILLRKEPGTSLVVTGLVMTPTYQPIEGALIEVWQTASNGLYDVQDPEQPQGHLRGSFETAADGSYAFETVLPVSYPIPDDGPVGQLLRGIGRHPNRPAHIHFMISKPGFRRLVTHLFIEGDPYLESDAVFGVKHSLIVKPEPDGRGGLVVERNFGLAPTASLAEACG